MLEPDRADAWAFFGQLNLKRDRLNDAQRAFQHAADLAPDTPAYQHALGSVRRLLNRPHDALEPLRTAVRLRPDHAPSMVELGLVLHALGSADDAEYWLTRALDVNPQAPTARRLLDHLQSAEAA